jgi:succinoglycan biosynthesis transport protein ExoP
VSRSQLPSSEPDVDFAPLGHHTTQEGRSIDIVRFAISIWKYLAAGLIAGCMLGALAYTIMGPTYVASASVMVSKKASASDQEARRYGDRGEHIHVLKSDKIARIAYEKYGLKEIPGFANSDDPLKDIWSSLTVVRTAGQESSFDNLIGLSYADKDKEIAKKVVESVVSAYAEWIESQRDKNSQGLLNSRVEAKKILEQELTDLEKEYADWRSNVPIYISSPQAVTAQGVAIAAQNVYQTKLTDVVTRQSLNADLIRKTRAKIDILKTMMASPEEREALQSWVLSSIASTTAGAPGESGGGAPGLMSAPSGKAELDQQLLTARMLERRLLLVLGEKHADVLTVRRQIETILDFYYRQGLTPPNLGTATPAAPAGAAAAGTNLAQQYLKVLESKLEELQADKVSLTEAYAEAEKDARQASSYEVQDQSYKDDIARQKKELDGVIGQINSFELNRDQEGYSMSRTNDIRVERSLKQVIKVVGAFGILGLITVFGLAYFREWYDTTLKSIEEIRNVIGAAIMGAVPRFRLNDRLSTLNGMSPSLVYYHRPGSREAEAYRSLRTTLFHSLKDGTDKVIQITSAEPGDGKSTTSANLAIAIAQSGKKVLLIDGDLRRPTMHTLFGLPQDIGLTDVLMSEIEWPNAVRSTRLPGLSVLTAGLCPSSPAELLSNQRLPEMLKAARGIYDLIIVDTPPILAVSDPAIISPHIDGLLLVVRMGKNKRAAAQRARETIDSHGIRLYGVIANDVDYSTDEGVAYNEYDKYYAPDQTAPPTPVAPAPSREPVGTRG